MNLSRLRDVCLALPGVTEQVQWGDHLVFKVGGKMFCVGATAPSPPHVCSFKSAGEHFVELCEREGIVPAPYLARAQWVAVDEWGTLADAEFRTLLERAYEIVRARLPRRVQATLAGSASRATLDLQRTRRVEIEPRRQATRPSTRPVRTRR